MSAFLKPAPIENVEGFFDEEDNSLPTFNGDSFAAHVECFATLARRDKWAHWRQCAIAASLARQFGQRTDLDNGETLIQQFCRLARIGESHFSRLVRTFRTFAGPLAPGRKELVEDDRLSFKHLLVAANHDVQPFIALREAVDCGWSANQLLRMLAMRKCRELLDADGAPTRPTDDNHDADEVWQNAPTPYREAMAKPPRTTRFVLTLTERERRELGQHLRAVAGILGTASDSETFLAMAKKAAAEWAPGTTAAAVEDVDEQQARLPMLLVRRPA